MIAPAIIGILDSLRGAPLPVPHDETIAVKIEASANNVLCLEHFCCLTLSREIATAPLGPRNDMVEISWLRRFQQSDKLKGTSKNYPFAILPDLLPQLFLAKIPQYTKYSGISATQFVTKSLAQIIKK